MEKNGLQNSRAPREAFIEEIRKKLLDLKDAFTQRREKGIDSLQNSRIPTTGDLADSAQDLLEDEVASLLLDIDNTTLEQIDAALAAIRSGHYGICQGNFGKKPCGKKIPTSRLEAMPFAPYCIDCQREFERLGHHGASGRVSFGRLSAVFGEKMSDVEGERCQITA